MAWSAPNTAVAGEFTAADFNTYVRDNLNETLPALASAAGNWFIADAANSLVERGAEEDLVGTSQSTTNTAAYIDLSTTGPSVTMTTGTFAIVTLTAGLENSSANAASLMSYAVSGATTVAATDAVALITDGLLASNANVRSVSSVVTLNAGSNTFTAKYRAGSGTATFAERRLTVWSF